MVEGNIVGILKPEGLQVPGPVRQRPSKRRLESVPRKGDPAEDYRVRMLAVRQPMLLEQVRCRNHIVIQEKNERSRGFTDAPVPGVGRSWLVFPEQPERDERIFQLEDQLGGFILGAVVDHNHLKTLTGERLRGKTLEGAPQLSGAILRRNDYAYVHESPKPGLPPT